MNKVILIGNLAADPELKTTVNGISVATFSVAVQRTYTNAQGEREADFIRCVAYRGTADNVGRYLAKGSKVAVEGRIQNRSYNAQDGSKRYITEINCDSVQFLDNRNQQSQQGGYQNNQNQYQYNQQPNQPVRQSNNRDEFFDGPQVDISDDDLPF
jgi:single-strand DNA-binding protein